MNGPELVILFFSVILGSVAGGLIGYARGHSDGFIEACSRYSDLANKLRGIQK